MKCRTGESKMTDYNSKIINPFVTAASEVLISLLNEEPESFSLEDEGVTLSQAETDLMIIIGVSGDVQGRVVLKMVQEDALRLASVMLKADVREFDDMVRSALGEIANMITGNATIALEENGFASDITPPSLILGKNVFISPVKGAKMLTIAFETKLGKIQVILGLKEKES